jgi:presenilin-like A22 family membrane protease
MKHPTWITIILVAMFVVAQVFGLFVFSQYMNVNTKMPSKDTPIGQIQSNEVKDFNWQFIVIIVCAILIGTGICLYLIRSGKFNLLKIWVGTALFVNLLVAMGAFVSVILAICIAIILTALRMLLVKWKYYPYLHNATEIMLYGGFATLFAFVLNIWAVVILLVVVSIYDMIAVWKSKHMVKLAKGLIKGNIFSGLLINYKGKKAILGGGDIAFPLLASVVMLRNFSWLPALCVIAGSTVALIVLFSISKKGKFYPAMPYISTGVFIGMLIGWLI